MDLNAYQKYALKLLGAFSVIFIILAISPSDRHDWLLENVLVFILVPILFFTSRKLPLSRISYTLIFLFLCLHEIGAHYTYAQVPYDQWFESIFGRTLNSIFDWERNHFDRSVHFSYGLLLAYPIRELFHRVANVSGFWGYFLPLDVTMSTSMLFELFEWAAVIVFGGELGVAYLGTQGDIWDAHKDMGLASIGAVIAMLVTAIINYRLQKDFSKEMADSFKIKNKNPLGEEEIKRMINEKKEKE